MANPSARAELYTRLSETIGVESAGTLMSYLPGDEPATKSDIEGLRADMAGLRVATKSDIEGLRVATKSDINAAKSEVTTVLTAEFKGEVVELSARIDGLENRMDGFDQRLDGFDKPFDIFDGKIDGFHRALLTQTRHFMLAIVGSTFSIIAVVGAVGLRPI